MDPETPQTQPGEDRSSEDYLPPNLPRPVDDHCCDHLCTFQLPSLLLTSTKNETIDLSKLNGLTVLFCYPRTGKPKDPVPDDWNVIPGARGCTPQACSFNVATSELKGLGISNIFGLSTQETEHQKLTREHLRLSYHLLSDEHFKLCEALGLPMFEYGKWRLVKRVTMVIEDGKIIWVDYPVFPPDKSAEKVVEYLKTLSINKPAPGDVQPAADPPAGAGPSNPVPAVKSPAPADEGSKRQGPASNFHLCQEWVEKKAREASKGTTAEKDKSSNSITGEIAGPGKKYAFHFSGSCTTN
ncbi:uncharacterized protein BKCO1_15000106 [Diplodia corticola]|uniref:Redoxin domain-containing protein n=1 Tax=Diplodia corticola TaxID=236234 RepID=A0A1J9R6B5_9PEZI|nr:uncharacterized protein BKCO1_15000106 [Diplodia corticola]OJD35738.1 hypothetical protein BKCO1_15000106 [Diplodia corticola]